ncbi:oligosaccharide flippase family protein [Serratia bockelmannii]|uniref:oligosaccharide flippase family protein n=1 Tax=Serratia bockelmannii TaxID=2703793 RepID=UPI0018D7A37D|nr:oligosaccharide flippase family protein [Serratia marcescens]
MNILKNSYWISAEKIVTVLGLIFVTSYVAKYIGPENFGKLAFSTTIFAVIQSISLLGTDSIIFKRACANKNSCFKLMSAVKRLRAFIHLSLSALALIWFYFNSDYLTFIFLLASCISVYFVTQDVLRVFNEATLNSKKNTLANLVGLVVAIFFRYVIAVLSLDPAWLAAPIILVSLIPYLIRKWNYRLQHKIVIISEFQRRRYIYYTLVVGVPLAISGISVTIYTRFSQFVLIYYYGDSELGVFSAASTIATSWAFIPLSIVTSYFSIIYKEKTKENIEHYVLQANKIAFSISILAVVGVLLTGREVLSFLFGNAYLSAYYTLVLLTVASLFSVMGVVSYRYIIKKSGYHYLSIKALMVTITSIISAIFFVPGHGSIGAAYSILLTEFASLTFFNYFFRRGEIGKMHLSMFSLNK